MSHSPGDDNDDQHWLDLIAGRDAPEADGRTRKEAAWLRAALLSYRVAAPPGAPADADARAHRLLARAHAAGVLPAAAAANDAQGPITSSRRWRRWPQALAASVLLCAATVLLLPRQSGMDDDSVLRGAVVQTLPAAAGQTAAARRDEVLQSLRAAGFDAQPFERLGRPGIDLALAVPLPPDQAAALKSLGLTPPPGPSLQIEFTSPPPAR